MVKKINKLLLGVVGSMTALSLLLVLISPLMGMVITIELMFAILCGLVLTGFFAIDIKLAKIFN